MDNPARNPSPAGRAFYFQQVVPSSLAQSAGGTSAPRFEVGPYHTEMAFFLHLRGGRRLQMPEYKVYVLRDDGHVISRVDLFCDGVEQAKE
jgi:hypothetical protein